MCSINWTMFGDMLTRVGTIFIGIATILTLLFEFGSRAKSTKLENHLMKLMYSKYMASEEGIVWSDYPADAEQTIKHLSIQTGIEANIVKQLLDKLKKEGEI